MMTTFIRMALVGVIGLALATASLAQEPPLISELSHVDKEYMQQQRDHISELTGRHFGAAMNGNTTHDMPLLQRLLDDKVVQPTQTKELQAMGILLGDLLATDLKLHWVVYADSIGRSHALRFRETEEYLFPVTMISRRREVGNESSVAEIYQRAFDIMSTNKPALPFQ